FSSPLERGVPHGSILESLLFISYPMDPIIHPIFIDPLSIAKLDHMLMTLNFFSHSPLRI
ncbi:hypothetical protein WA026_001228, partial [Henosepilachna vigintioctopunctata]